MDASALADLDPFGLCDTETGRLDRFFGSLDQQGWERPSRCHGWRVRDVLAHLAGEEEYNHACLDHDLEGFRARVVAAGLTGGYDEFNEWCVDQRRDRPAGQVLAEWRQANEQTRARMTALGRDAMLTTGAGPYPNGLQAFHYASEWATHADDVGAPVDPGEETGRTAWRMRFGLFALAERDSPVHAHQSGDAVTVQLGSLTAELTAADFIEATVGRLPAGHPLAPGFRDALRCLA